MESDEEKIEVIKIKVRNTLNLKKINPDVLGWVEKRSTEKPPFRGHYYTPHDLTADIKLIDDLNKQKELIAWLKKQKTGDSIIKQALDDLAMGIMRVNNFPLSWKKCKAGAEGCLENADRLLQDAYTLFENKAYVTSSCLAIYTTEEIGKGTELLELFKTQEDLSESKWKHLTKGSAQIKKIMRGQQLAHEYLKQQFPKLYRKEIKIHD